MPDSQSLKQWRRDTRARLLEQRLAVSQQQRKIWDAAIEATLHTILPTQQSTVIGLYWPFKGEFETRPLMRRLYAEGLCPALPAVVVPKAPLEFRQWYPKMEMVRGVYNIPVPKMRRVVRPTVVLAPLVGFDEAGYRLGYGGGYYDRTLAALESSPWVIGLGYELSRLDTLDPQPHDMAMDMIVTEAGAYDYRRARG
jgi:5-formyltetrahydrofolate cyclo-ligase